jgi:hypothetical protein
MRDGHCHVRDGMNRCPVPLDNATVLSNRKGAVEIFMLRI